MSYIFEKDPHISFYGKPEKLHTVYRIDEHGNRELYIEKGSPVLYTYGMWADILKAGIHDPGLQELIDKMIVYYRLSKE